MTRENARKQLMHILAFLNPQLDGADVKALNMAIDELEQDKPKQPDTCPIYDGVCGYPIEFCSECPRHKSGVSAETWGEISGAWTVRFAPNECEDAISRGVLEQVMWERDIAIEQLHELGYELGQKIEPCEDAISRATAKTRIYLKYVYKPDECKTIFGILDELPSVTQKSDEQLYKNGFADGYEQGHKDAEQKSGKWIDADRW